mmetsp:Transcript_26244/g.75148  ORF Transcript_26244/g.75148 Transcript_26244/m.75148 type:complete len:93 (+) Transcript_26244:201-479(+)
MMMSASSRPPRRAQARRPEFRYMLSLGLQRGCGTHPLANRVDRKCGADCAGRVWRQLVASGAEARVRLDWAPALRPEGGLTQHLAQKILQDH